MKNIKQFLIYFFIMMFFISFASAEIIFNETFGNYGNNSKASDFVDYNNAYSVVDKYQTFDNGTDYFYRYDNLSDTNIYYSEYNGSDVYNWSNYTVITRLKFDTTNFYSGAGLIVYSHIFEKSNFYNYLQIRSYKQEDTGKFRIQVDEGGNLFCYGGLRITDIIPKNDTWYYLKVKMINHENLNLTNVLGKIWEDNLTGEPLAYNINTTCIGGGVVGHAYNGSVGFYSRNTVSDFDFITVDKTVSEQEQPINNITDCMIINESGTYEFIDNITTSQEGVCIEIKAGNVLLDCNGYSLYNLNASNSWIGFNLWDYDNITIQNCYLDRWRNAIIPQNSSYVHDKITLKNIYFNDTSVVLANFNSKNSLFQNLTINHTRELNGGLQRGLEFINGSNNIIKDCNFYSVNGTGIFFHNSNIHNNITITNNYFENHVSTGEEGCIRTGEFTNSIIKDNIFNDVYKGIVLTGSDWETYNIILDNNSFNDINDRYGNYGFGIQSYVYMDNITVSNNIFDNATDSIWNYCIQLQYTNNSNVFNNQFIDCDKSGFRANNNNENMNIYNNNFTDCNFSLYVRASNNINIYDNIITNNEFYALYIRDSDYIDAYNNIIDNTLNLGIYLLSSDYADVHNNIIKNSYDGSCNMYNYNSYYSEVYNNSFYNSNCGYNMNSDIGIIGTAFYYNNIYNTAYGVNLKNHTFVNFTNNNIYNNSIYNINTTVLRNTTSGNYYNDGTVNSSLGFCLNQPYSENNFYDYESYCCLNAWVSGCAYTPPVNTRPNVNIIQPLNNSIITTEYYLIRWNKTDLESDNLLCNISINNGVITSNLSETEFNYNFLPFNNSMINLSVICWENETAEQLNDTANSYNISIEYTPVTPVTPEILSITTTVFIFLILYFMILGFALLLKSKTMILISGMFGILFSIWLFNHVEDMGLMIAVFGMINAYLVFYPIFINKQ